MSQRIPNAASTEGVAEQRPQWFEPLLGIAQAAELLKINGQTLKKMAIRGEVPALKIGNRWRFRACDLQTWVEARVQWPQHSSERLAQ